MVQLLNKGYEKKAYWSIDGQRITWSSYMTVDVNKIEMEVTVNADSTELTAEITHWDGVDWVRPTDHGTGFIDSALISWFDTGTFWGIDQFFPNGYKDYPHPDTSFQDSNGQDATWWTFSGSPIHFKNEDSWYSEQFTNSQGVLAYREPESHYREEMRAMFEKANVPNLWDNTFYEIWQGSEGADNNNEYRKGLTEFRDHFSHSWTLTEDDFNEDGSLKQRPLFFIWNRYYDHESIAGSDLSKYYGCSPNHSHWNIHYMYFLDGPDFCWKYHPLAIRKEDGQWYSCNRKTTGSDSYNGQYGDGHVGIRDADGSWNAVWNDDLKVGESECLYNLDGQFVSLPRVGIGFDVARTNKDDADNLHQKEA